MLDRARVEKTALLPYHTFADRTAELARRPSAERRKVRDDLLARVGALDPETRRLLDIRIEDLLDYQGRGYAKRYVDVLSRAANAERNVMGATGELTQAVARNLHKLMAYKDEYEVARLLTQNTFRERALAGFAPGAKLYFNLQPPLLRAFGMKKKIALGAWFAPVLKVLATLRILRGTPLDIFVRPDAARRTPSDRVVHGPADTGVGEFEGRQSRSRARDRGAARRHPRL